MDLFDDGGGDGHAKERVSVNKKFAREYDERKRKEALSKSKKFMDDQESVSTEEDEAAELLSEKVETKFFETLTKIKERDPVIKDPNKSFFEDDDFKQDKKSKKQAAVRYSDFARKTLMEEGADAFTKEEELFEKGKRKETPVELQKRLKAELKKAAKDDDDDDFFTIKNKSAEEQAEEE